MLKLFLAGFISFNLFTMTSCQKETDLSGECIRVKVISSICGEIILQILDSSQYDKGENGWANGKSGPVIDHAFFARLGCTDMAELAGTNPIDNILYVKIIKEQTDQNCAVCLASHAYRPVLTHHIDIVKECR
jgi:hypothetical protein